MSSLVYVKHDKPSVPIHNALDGISGCTEPPVLVLITTHPDSASDTLKYPNKLDIDKHKNYVHYIPHLFLLHLHKRFKKWKK